MREADVRRLQEQLKALHRRQRREAVDTDGLTQTAVGVLGSIARRPEQCRPGLIAEELGLTSSNVAAALRELDSRGFITRSKDEHDTRRTNIHLTPAGGVLVASNRHERDGWLSRAIDAVLDEDEQTRLLEAGILLERLSRFDGEADTSEESGS